MALPLLKLIGALSVCTVVKTTVGEKTRDSGSLFEDCMPDHPVRKEVASLPDCPLGVDTMSGFETKLMGEATGAVLMPLVVHVKM